MEWTVVTVIIALVGLFFTIGKPIMSLVSEFQAVQIETGRQEKEIDRNIESIKELVKLSQSHEQRLTEQQKRLCEDEIDMKEVRAQTSELLRITQSHEARITHLEVVEKEGIKR